MVRLALLVVVAGQVAATTLEGTAVTSGITGLTDAQAESLFKTTIFEVVGGKTAVASVDDVYVTTSTDAAGAMTATYSAVCNPARDVAACTAAFAPYASSPASFGAALAAGAAASGLTISPPPTCSSFTAAEAACVCSDAAPDPNFPSDCPDHKTDADCGDGCTWTCASPAATPAPTPAPTTGCTAGGGASRCAAGTYGIECASGAACATCAAGTSAAARTSKSSGYVQHGPL